MKTLLMLVASLFLLSFIGVSSAQTTCGEMAQCPTGQKCVNGKCVGKAKVCKPCEISCPVGKTCNCMGKCVKA